MAHKYVFGVYSKEDIEQEGFIIACAALKDYNPDYGPLENFLRTHLSNRLKNFKRNHSYRINSHCNYCEKFTLGCPNCEQRQHTQEIKKNIQQPIDLESVDSDGELRKMSYRDLDNLELKEIVDYINKNLPVQYRKDYLKMKEGAYVPKSRKEEIERVIEDILNGYQ